MWYEVGEWLCSPLTPRIAASCLTFITVFYSYFFIQEIVIQEFKRTSKHILTLFHFCISPPLPFYLWSAATSISMPCVVSGTSKYIPKVNVSWLPLRSLWDWDQSAISLPRLDCSQSQLGSANFPVSVDWRGKTSLTSKTHIAKSVDGWNGRVAEAAWLRAGAQCLGQPRESPPNRCNIVKVCLCCCFCLCFSFGRQMNRHWLCFQSTD